jgi:hypothetical protein
MVAQDASWVAPQRVRAIVLAVPEPNAHWRVVMVHAIPID